MRDEEAHCGGDGGFDLRGPATGASAGRGRGLRPAQRGPARGVDGHGIDLRRPVTAASGGIDGRAGGRRLRGPATVALASTAARGSIWGREEEVIVGGFDEPFSFKSPRLNLLVAGANARPPLLLRLPVAGYSEGPPLLFLFANV